LGKCERFVQNIVLAVAAIKGEHAPRHVAGAREPRVRGRGGGAPPAAVRGLRLGFGALRIARQDAAEHPP